MAAVLVAAAVCPHPPLLIPAVAAGAAAELDRVRAAALAAVTVLQAADAGVLLVVGAAPAPLAYSSADWGDFAPYGVRLPVRLGPGTCAGQPILPLALTVGAWLLRQTDYRGDRQGFGVPADWTGAEAAAAGAAADALDHRVALLVMGDGTARRSERAPGALDPRAAPYDDAVAAALAAADTAALLALEPALSAELMVAGRPSWQLLAGAAQTAGGRWRGELLAHAAPYGVGYFVATWTRT